MSPSHEEALFSLALEKPPAKHPSFLDTMCDGDATLRQRLEALLAAHEQPDQALANLSAVFLPTLKVEFPVTPDEAVGQAVGRFKPLDKVGEGGCGAVYVAEQAEPVRRRRRTECNP